MQIHTLTRAHTHHTFSQNTNACSHYTQTHTRSRISNTRSHTIHKCARLHTGSRAHNTSSHTRANTQGQGLLTQTPCTCTNCPPSPLCPPTPLIPPANQFLHRTQSPAPDPYYSSPRPPPPTGCPLNINRTQTEPADKTPAARATTSPTGFREHWGRAITGTSAM